MNVEKTLEAGKVQSGVVTQESVSLQGDSLEARIRQIVREEIAAFYEEKRRRVLENIKHSANFSGDITISATGSKL